MREILRNLSWRALRVWQRDADVYFTVWKTEFLPPLLEPILYVFAFGLGLGQLVHEVHYQGRTLHYLAFVAPGIVAVAIMFWAFFETTFSSYVRMYYQKTFDAILATPLLVEDVIVGELLWGATKSVVAATIMLLVLTAMNLVSWPSGLWVLPIAAVGGLLFAGLGLIMTSLVKTISQFNVPVFVLIMPMFTFGGTFFPIDVLPRWALAIAWCLPLTHLALLARAAILGWWHPMIVPSALYVGAMAAVLAAWSLQRMKRRLIQ
ncbi:MAG TPA: ABC transporter permease [Candidatus Eisenbacteria bacterium]